ncbi:3-oxoacyl-[acyl-carrier protein] reductase [Saccharopolyspora kobensis]|uniref:3-oxoacyl-[acyl-carrier protein] reductase n=1 Tax=Saccharopolyspora kobensis TaxID=146035 RepID=A0A1H5WKW3_9PSEU|nr:SDR family oxidoreductase [Saccharopolyspora kobensis]SEF99916.1 3-oxoacyl-[acyl-carrier protein] reductase [Saccharopolyspora kobensis]SFD76596.1 3-oxoacyl-[acyl-carrier protein] reductase [Saccharopolyspora kobensis]
MIDPRLRDRVAVITGATSPLDVGAAIARALARQGCKLVLAETPQGTRTDHVREALRADGAEAESLVIDLTRPEAAPAVFDHAEAAFGPVEILVNNAAHRVPDTFQPNPVRDLVTIDATGLDAHHAVNTRAPALLMAEFHRRHLRRRADWGRIINISADTAPGTAEEISHSATKNALESLSRAAAAEFGPAGTTVNVISPGPVQTGWLNEATRARLAELSPLRRVGRPDDIADLAVFLASHQARWITGQTIYAGGGKRML